MNRAQMEEYMRMLAERQREAMEAPKDEEGGAGAASRPQVVVFAVGGDERAVPIRNVKTVVGMPEVTPLPFAPAHYRGVMNLRGRIVSVIDLRAQLGVRAVSTPHNAVIVLESGAQCVGMIVDSINRVVDVSTLEQIGRVEILDVDRLLTKARA